MMIFQQIIFQKGRTLVLLPSVFLSLLATQFKPLADEPGFSSSDPGPPPACRWAGFDCPSQKSTDTESFLKNITNVLRRDIRSGEDLRTNRIKRLLKVINQGTDQQVLSLIRTIKKHPHFTTPKISQAVFERVNKIKKNNLSFYSQKIIPALESFGRFESFLHTSLQNSIKKPSASKRITSLARGENLDLLGIFEDIYGNGWKAKKLKNSIQADIQKAFNFNIKRLPYLTWDHNKFRSEALLVGAQLSNSFIVPFINQAVKQTSRLYDSRRDIKSLRNAAIQAAGDNLLKAGYLNRYNTLKTGDLTRLSDVIVREGSNHQIKQRASARLARQATAKIKGTKAEKYLNESGLFYNIMQTPSIQTALGGNSSVSLYNTHFVADQDFNSRTDLIKNRLKYLFGKEPNELERLQSIDSSLHRVGGEFASALAEEGSMDKNEDVRVVSMSVAKNLPDDPTSVSILQRGLQDSNGFVQREAVKGLAQKQAGPNLLLSMYENDTRLADMAHHEILKQAGKIGGPAGIQLLQTGVYSHKIRSKGRDTANEIEADIIAVESATKIGSEGLRFLTKMYDQTASFYSTDTSEGIVKTAIINAVGRIDGPSPVKSRLVEKAMMFSYSSGLVEVRVAAVNAISRFDSDKTEQVLKQGLTDNSDKVFQASMQVLNARLAAGYRHLPMLRQMLVDDDGGTRMVGKRHRVRQQQRMGTIQNLINRYSD